MKKIFIFALIAISLAGYVYYQGTTSQNADPAASVPQAPSNNIGGDVNVCVGSADYCKGLVDTERQSLDYQNEQFILQLTAMAPTPMPTKSPDDITRENREDEARTNVIIVALYALVIIGIIAGLAWIAWQLYWHFTIKAPRDEQAADIRTSKDGKLVVARLPGNPNHANSADQWIALDQNSMGAQLIHIDTAGFAHQLKLSDHAAQYVAIANALRDAGKSNQGREFMQSLLEQWTRGTNSTIQSLGEAAAKWRGSGRRHTDSSESSSLIKKDEPVVAPQSEGASVQWEDEKSKK